MPKIRSIGLDYVHFLCESCKNFNEVGSQDATPSEFCYLCGQPIVGIRSLFRRVRRIVNILKEVD